ncbi:hypothetical protein J6590_078764 [Homalodisca vitripennis]|nr:hypothetical protein J6590_078764 [Homalodisca vitripennis]
MRGTFIKVSWFNNGNDKSPTTQLLLLCTLNVTRTVNIHETFQRLANRVRETGNVQLNHNKKKQFTRPVRDDKSPEVWVAGHLNPHD